MRVVVADTGPLNYLALIEAIELLPRLFGTVLAPEIVLTELERARGRRRRSVHGWRPITRGSTREQRRRSRPCRCRSSMTASARRLRRRGLSERR